MMLFCDTSALMKLYIVEKGSESLKLQLTQVKAIVTCCI